MTDVRPITTWTSTQRAVATGMAAAGAVLLVSAAAMALLSIGRPIAVTWGTQVGQSIWAAGLLTFTVTGWLAVRSDARNRAGWVMLAVGVAAGFHLASTYYGVIAVSMDPVLPGGLVAAWVGNWGWVIWIGAIGIVLTQLFPNGEPVSPRWWPVIGFLMVGLFAAAAGEAFAAGPLEVDPRYEIGNPYGSDSALVSALANLLATLPLGIVLGVVSLVIRYRRGGPVTRAQLRWFLTTMAVLALTFPVVVYATPSNVTGDAIPLGPRIGQDAVTTLWSLSGAAIGLAVLRYRLYAIDVVINRALVYGSLSALLAATYLGAVFLLQRLLAPLAGGGQVAVAVSTLLVAALFVPLRRRLQSGIDRRFYRARYDAERLLEGFSSQLRRDIDLDSILIELENAARGAVLPASSSVWLRPR